MANSYFTPQLAADKDHGNIVAIEIYLTRHDIGVISPVVGRHANYGRIRHCNIA